MDFTILTGSPKEQYMQLRGMRSGLVLDQIAFYAPAEYQTNDIASFLGLPIIPEWTEDIVTGRVSVFGGPEQESKARLLFNYDHGIEIEILTYLEGPNWHAQRYGKLLRAREPFVSHLGFHVNDEPIPTLPFRVAQSMVTTHHTNPAIAGRAYRYVIYDTKAALGVDLKYIERLK